MGAVSWDALSGLTLRRSGEAWLGNTAVVGETWWNYGWVTWPLLGDNAAVERWSGDVVKCPQVVVIAAISGSSREVAFEAGFRAYGVGWGSWCCHRGISGRFRVAFVASVEWEATQNAIAVVEAVNSGGGGSSGGGTKSTTSTNSLAGDFRATATAGFGNQPQPQPQVRLFAVAVRSSCGLFRLVQPDLESLRGISSLYILQSIMAKVTRDKNAKPCDYFDMIAGTSTGGLIAVMLARLQMTIPECIATYTQLASKIFAATPGQMVANFLAGYAKYDAKVFERELKALLKKVLRTEDENVPMLDPDTNNRCKAFVVSSRYNGSQLEIDHFRTYATEFPDRFGNSAIWQAARATSAAPVYFPSIEINGATFVDGGTQRNNPSILLQTEAKVIFGSSRPIGCLISIGTGMQSTTAKPEAPAESGFNKFLSATMDVFKTAISVMTETEETHKKIQESFRKAGNEDLYFRFNAGVKERGDWVPMIALDDYKGMDKLVELTKTYLVGQTEAIERCASKVTG
ncbi:acyl transferase/acyl hydrolase/lysophospholipase [Lyophyllum atratum]|nr:acyl transferase/acyl hydrolase/lysophospholipase [Lyophyllum atratum]